VNRALLAKGEGTGGAISYDFRAFFHRGGASLGPMASRDDLARRRVGPVQHGRVALVEALHQAFLERKLSGSAPSSLSMYIVSMRTFWKFCDREKLQFSGLNVAPVRTAIAKFANEQVQRFRSGEIQERSVGKIAWPAVGLLADALNVESGELTSRRVLPRFHGHP